MIASPQFSSPMTPEAYLAWEEQQELRYEYEQGRIVAMTGGTIAHSDLAVNLLLALGPHAIGMGCRINNSDAKVQISDNGPYYYPDLSVSCDPRNLQFKKLIRYPKLIIEVLSPSTELRDRNVKFRAFKQSETLEEYVLVDSRTMRVESYNRSQGRFWTYRDFEAGETVRFESLDFECPIEAIYQRISIEAEAQEGEADL